MPARTQNDSLGGVPVLVSAAGTLEAAARRGCILLYHGLGGHKGVQQPELERLALAGFLAIGPDAVGHGERRWPDYEQRFAADGERAFYEVVQASVAELPRLIDALQQRGWCLARRLGLAGVSMGAFIGYSAAVSERRLGAVVAICGSPDFGKQPGSPHAHLDRFAPLPLFSVTAELDQTVPPRSVHELHRALAPSYVGQPERLRHLAWPESGHFMRAEDWDCSWREAIAWFTRFLE